jgi:hypothetical protein
LGFIGGENHRPAALTNFITWCCTPNPERDSNSQQLW